MEPGSSLFVIANHFALTIEEPTSQGSISTLKDPCAERRSVGEGLGFGEKMRRKVLSALRCRTVRDIPRTNLTNHWDGAFLIHVEGYC